MYAIKEKKSRNPFRKMNCLCAKKVEEGAQPPKINVLSKNNGSRSVSTTASSPQTPPLHPSKPFADGLSPPRTRTSRTPSPMRELNREQLAWDETEGQVLGETFSRRRFILSYKGSLTDYYDVETATLGKGTYGSVTKGINKATGEIRAIKTIAKTKLKNIERFRQEIAIMKTLDHPNIIKLYETFEDHKNIYLALELCSGGELFDRIIERGYFSESDAGIIMRQIMRALYYCHEHGIVHRDLKPENFLFLDPTEDAPLKIIDFGLAARWEPTSYLSTKAGTPYYVAPQVLMGKYTNKCDIWSAGVIMYILLCGYPPFAGDNDADILRKVKTGRVEFNEKDWRGVSLEARHLVTAMLTFNPDMRCNAAQTLVHPWIRHYATKANPPSDSILTDQILQNFKTFRAVSQLKKAALTVIAQQMSEKQISDLKNVFMSMDENGDGSLTVEELTKGLQKAGIKPGADLGGVLNYIDSDGSGVIDYTEFVAASLDKRQYIQENACWAAFRVFDVDGNGKITPEEILQVMGSKKVRGVFSPSDIAATQQMIREVDANGDGEIDFDEFMQMMRTKN